MKFISQLSSILGKQSLLRAVVDREDIPARGKLLLCVFAVSALGLVALGIAKANSEAFGWLLGATVAIALLICLPERR